MSNEIPTPRTDSASEGPRSYERLQLLNRQLETELLAAKEELATLKAEGDKPWSILKADNAALRGELARLRANPSTDAATSQGSSAAPQPEPTKESTVRSPASYQPTIPRPTYDKYAICVHCGHPYAYHHSTEDYCPDFTANGKHGWRGQKFTPPKPFPFDPNGVNGPYQQP